MEESEPLLGFEGPLEVPSLQWSPEAKLGQAPPLVQQRMTLVVRLLWPLLAFQLAQLLLQYQLQLQLQ